MNGSWLYSLILRESSFVAGCIITGGWCYWSNACPREVVPWPIGPLLQLSQYNARAGCVCGILHVPGHSPGPPVDGPRPVSTPTSMTASYTLHSSHKQFVNQVYWTDCIFVSNWSIIIYNIILM